MRSKACCESFLFLSYCLVFLVQIQSVHQATGRGETEGKAGPKEAVKVPLAKPAAFWMFLGCHGSHNWAIMAHFAVYVLWWRQLLLVEVHQRLLQSSLLQSRSQQWTKLMRPSCLYGTSVDLYSWQGWCYLACLNASINHNGENHSVDVTHPEFMHVNAQAGSALPVGAAAEPVEVAPVSLASL
jgi:hypothetical protein